MVLTLKKKQAQKPVGQNSHCRSKHQYPQPIHFLRD